MRNLRLEGMKIAILAADGFEQSELEKPMTALRDHGAVVDIISPESGKIKAWNENDWGNEFSVTKTIKEADPMEYNSLILPGGVINPDKLRRNKDAVNFVRSFFRAGKPVAAICHGPQMLIEADVVDGRKLTSFPSIRKDLENAGAQWVDEEVVVDEGLVTSRWPDDISAFIDKVMEETLEGRHEEQTV